jgi:hypothetical protein
MADDEVPKILDLPIGLSATGMRKEFDSLGEVEVPADHYAGAPGDAIAESEHVTAGLFRPILIDNYLYDRVVDPLALTRGGTADLPSGPSGPQKS